MESRILIESSTEERFRIQEKRTKQGNSMRKTIFAVVALSILAWAGAAWAWDPDEVTEMEPKVAEVTKELLEKDPDMQRFFDKSVGYVVFPGVGKGGFGVGGARGTGLLKEGGTTTAVVTLTQLTFGFQAGGQAYSEFIFFEDDIALGNFKRGNYELGAQASAVAITAGASADAQFEGGMAIFTQAKGGLMYEASVGGQKFKIELPD
jgi:lipid-binding SYLF domain-containing protein